MEYRNMEEQERVYLLSGKVCGGGGGGDSE